MKKYHLIFRNSNVRHELRSRSHACALRKAVNICQAIGEFRLFQIGTGYDSGWRWNDGKIIIR